MKTSAFLFPFFLNFIFTGEQSQVSDIEKAIQKSDFAGFVISSNDGTRDNPIVMVTESFKGDVQALRIKNVEINIDEGEEYLLIADKDGSLVTEINNPVTLVSRLPESALEMLNNLECYSDSVRMIHANGICTKQYDPVCGCDNKTYANMCFMDKEGIMRFKPGKCK